MSCYSHIRSYLSHVQCATLTFWPRGVCKSKQGFKWGGKIVSWDIWKPAGRLLQRFIQYTHPERHFKVRVHFEMFAWWLKWRKLCRVTLSKWTSSGDTMFFQRLDNHQCLSAQGPPPGYMQGKNKNNCDVKDRDTKGKRERSSRSGFFPLSSILSLPGERIAQVIFEQRQRIDFP